MMASAGSASNQSNGQSDAESGPTAHQRLQQRPQNRPIVRACLACRQMKMKCEGAENPPCVKCAKAGRECMPQLQHNTYQYAQILSQEQNRNNALSYAAAQMPYNSQWSSDYSPGGNTSPGFLIGTHSGSNRSSQVMLHTSTITALQDKPSHHEKAITVNGLSQERGKHSDIPSIYSTSPVDALNESSPPNSGLGLSQSHNKRRRSEVQNRETAIHSTSSHDTSSRRSENEEVRIPKRDLRDMVHMFCEKLLPFIPALIPDDFQNFDRLIETELSLVYCICYATARFLPDGRDIRDMLLPKVTRLLRDIVTINSPGTDDFSTFKALLILYAYAGCSSPSPQDSEPSRQGDLLFWPLKSLVEVYALRLSLHSSLQDLKAELRSKSPTPISHITSFRRYTFWLQLFIMSHYCSLISGTPPSIRIDSTIRAAPALMREIGPNTQIRLFGEVELCLIWEMASAQQLGLGEWWCLPDPSEDFDQTATNSMLMKADKAIDTWYNKWREYIDSGDGIGAVLDHLGRVARFCISSYAVRCLRSSPKGLSTIQKDQVKRCVAFANRVLDWPLSLRPIQKDKLRYISESGGIMLKFCCLFIIASCQTFTSCIPDVLESLENVKAVAQLMMNLAQDYEKKSRVYGQIIFDRAEDLRLRLEQRRIYGSSGRSSVTPAEYNIAQAELASMENISYEFDFGFNSDGTLTLDPFWDFSMLLPNTW